MRKYVIAIVVIIVIIALFFIVDIGISGIALNEETLADLEKQYPNNDILVVGIVQTSGTTWQIKNYPENMDGEEIVLDFPYELWLLKHNEELDFLGMQVRFILIAEKNRKMIKSPWSDEEFRLIKAKRIFIDSVSFGEDVGNLKLKDMSARGIFKAFVGLFIPSRRYSY